MPGHIRVIRVFLIVAALITAALDQTARAQSGVARPNFAQSQIPSLFYSVIPADINNDRRIDLIATLVDNSGAIVRTVFAVGVGDGTFGAPTNVQAGVGALAVGDFTDDGFQDVLVGDGAHVWMLAGRGDGTFDAAQVTALPALDPRTARVITADFNLDGNLDIAAVADEDAASTLYIAAGRPNGRFDAPVTYTTDFWTQRLVAADFNGDDKLDIAVSTRDAGLVDVFLNRGSMLFADGGRVSIGATALGIASTDINGDGNYDLIVGTALEDHGGGDVFTDSAVYVVYGKGDGTFGIPEAHAIQGRGPINVVIGDFNRDGILDIATGNASGGYDRGCDQFDGMPHSFSILPGLRGGGFGQEATFTFPSGQASPSPGANPFGRTHQVMRAADVNGDGRLDLVFSNGVIARNIAAGANHIPEADAGADRQEDPSYSFSLTATARDADNDWLSFEWRDDAGRIVGTLPHVCVGGDYSGTHTFTLTVRDGRGAAATDSVNITFTTIPSTWHTQDIGDVRAAGSAAFDGSTYTVRGSGADVWGNADEFHYVSQLVSGDFEFIARVASVQNVNAWTKAGLMLRETLNAASRHAFAIATPTRTKGLAFQRRTLNSGTTVNTAGPAVAPPVWLRLIRHGDVITATYRTSTTDWALLGAERFQGLNYSVYIGLAVSSHVDGTLATATFDNVEFTPLEAGPQLDVLRPLGGESVQVNAPYTIRWSPRDGAAPISRYDVFYSTGNENGPWAAIPECTNVAATMRSCIWQRPGPVSRTFIKVDATQAGTTATAVSESFTIDIAAHGSYNLPPGWVCGNVGSESQVNSFCNHDVEDSLTPVYTVRGSGSDIWGTQDNFMWAGTPVYGNFALTARVLYVQNINVWTKAGLMIRRLGTEEPTVENGDAPHASLFVTPTTAKGIAFQRRPKGGGTSVSTAGPALTAPIWIKLVRQGNMVFAYYRKNTTDAWTGLGSQIFDDLPYQLYAMLVVSSHVDGTPARAEFDNVTIDEYDQPWAQKNIGTAPVGEVGTSGANTEVTGGGADIWGTADAFQYYYTKWNGIGTMTVRVRSIENTNAWAKAGIMFRETLDPGSKHAFALVSAAKGATLQTRLNTNDETIPTSTVAVQAPMWLKFRRYGNTFEAYYSTDGEHYESLGGTELDVPSEIYVGLAVTSHNTGEMATAVFDDIHLEPR